jgi:hypothetical protein
MRLAALLAESGQGTPCPRQLRDRDIRTRSDCRLKRVYLDQNFWIELSRVRVGSSNAKDGYRDAYQLARFASMHGLASFPLSQTHMYETQKSQRWDARLDVVETMIELSRFHAIRHVTGVVPLEADFAIESLAGLDTPKPNVFAAGVDAILSSQITLPGNDIPDLRALGYRDSFVNIADGLGRSRTWDAVLLAGPPPGSVAEGLLVALRSVDNAFAVDQTEVATKIKSLSIRGAQLEEALTQYTLLEVKHELYRAAEGCGIRPDAIVDMMIRDPSAMLQILPSRHVVHGMYMQHAQPQKRWKPNDLHDITALGVAVPYCDAVATEGHWVDMLHRRKLGNLYETTLISSPEGLVNYLSHL